MQVTIPETLTARLQQLATKQSQPIDQIVTERLSRSLDEELDNLPTQEQAELRALHYLSNDALRAIASEQMSAENQQIMQRLMLCHNQGELNPEEQSVLTELVERGERLMLRKAEAIVILQSRGVTNASDYLTKHD